MRASGIAVLVLVVGVILVASACKEPVPENNSCEGEWFTKFLAAEDAPTVDLTCAGDALTTAPAFDPSCQVTSALDARTVNHQSKNPVGGMSVDFFQGDDLAAAPDWSATSDDAGAFTQPAVPLCTPIAYVNDRNTTDSRVTVGQHVILEPGDAGATPTFDFRNVANGTLSLITTILAVDLKDENGFMFGFVAGCDGEVAVDKVQVLVRDQNCSLPPDFSAGYTSGEFPSGFLRSTTTDGFFFGTNVPPGDWIVEGYVHEGDKFRLVAAAPITVTAGQVTLADLQLGRSDGVRLRAKCTGTCG